MLDPKCLVTPFSSFRVDYVDGQLRVRVFDYNPTAHTFEATALATGRATVTVATHTITFAIQGVTAAVISDAGEIQCGTFSVRQPADQPRLEFFRHYKNLDQRLAILTKTKILSALNLLENAPIATDDQFRFFTLASFATTGVYCNSLNEAL